MITEKTSAIMSVIKTRVNACNNDKSASPDISLSLYNNITDFLSKVPHKDFDRDVSIDLHTNTFKVTYTKLTAKNAKRI
jgi:hypothetical protein